MLINLIGANGHWILYFWSENCIKRRLHILYTYLDRFEEGFVQVKLTFDFF